VAWSYAVSVSRLERKRNGSAWHHIGTEESNRLEPSKSLHHILPPYNHQTMTHQVTAGHQLHHTSNPWPHLFHVGAGRFQRQFGHLEAHGGEKTREQFSFVLRDDRCFLEVIVMAPYQELPGTRDD